MAMRIFNDSVNAWGFFAYTRGIGGVAVAPFHYGDSGYCVRFIPKDQTIFGDTWFQRAIVATTSNAREMMLDIIVDANSEFADATRRRAGLEPLSHAEVRAAVIDLLEKKISEKCNE